MKRVLFFIESLMVMGAIFLVLEIFHVETMWLRVVIGLALLMVFFFVHLVVVAKLAGKSQKEPKKDEENLCDKQHGNRVFYLLCTLSLVACAVLYAVGLCDIKGSASLLLILLSVAYLGVSLERMVRH